MINFFSCLEDVFHFLPEVYIITALLFFILLGSVYSTSVEYHYPLVIKSHLRLSLFVLFISFLLVYSSMDLDSLVFYSSLKVDSFTQLLKLFSLFFVFVNLFYSLDYITKERVNSFEYVLLVLLSLVGMLFLISSNSLIAIYLNLELQSLSFYILTSYNRTNEQSTEAGLKYFIFGAFSSGVLLFGLSFLYAMTGLYTISDISVLFSDLESAQNYPLGGILLSVIFILGGLLFKFYSAPFHVWVPDIYQGSPAIVTSLFATVPLFSIGGLFVRIFYVGFFDLFNYWQPILIACSILSLAVGCFSAIYQKNIRRFLAYSSIANVGFLLMALSTGTLEGLQSFFFYSISYVITLICFFSAYLSLRKHKTFNSDSLIEYLSEFGFLYKANPLLAISLAISLFSMAGVPPLLGFFGKYYVFTALIQNSMHFVFIVSVFLSTVSAFYYLRCIKLMYFDTKKVWPFFSPMSRDLALITSITIFVLVFFLAHPSYLLLIASKLSLSCVY